MPQGIRYFRDCDLYWMIPDDRMEDFVHEVWEDKTIKNEVRMLVMKLWKEYNLANDHRRQTKA